MRPRRQTEIVSGAHPGAGARIAYTRAISEHRCFPKKRLSTHTMHFKWHHRNLSNQSECDSAVYCSLHRTQGCHLVFFDFLIPKMPKNTNFSGNPDGTWSVQLFLPGPWRFLLGPCPSGPHPGDGATGETVAALSCYFAALCFNFYLVAAFLLLVGPRRNW